MESVKRQTFAISFICRKSKTNKTGTAPVEVSISINSNRVIFSLPHREKPHIFKKAMASNRLSTIKQYTNDCYDKICSTVDQMQKEGITLDVNLLKTYYFEGFKKVYTVGMLMDEYIDLLKYQGMGEDNLKRYEMVRDKFLSLVSPCTELSKVCNADILKYIADINKEYKQSTAYHKVSRLKSFFIYAVNNGKLSVNPFGSIKINKHDTPVDTISPDEYDRILTKKFDCERLEKVRDLFVLCCNSGLAYIDMVGLQPHDISVTDAGVVIDKLRQKTKQRFYSVVLKDGVDVLNKYGKDISVLKISNQKLNSYLKEIRDICGITSVESLHFHLGRHYYITNLIRKGVPVATVAKCAGHSQLRMTLRYTHLKSDDILNEVNKHI